MDSRMEKEEESRPIVAKLIGRQAVVWSIRDADQLRRMNHLAVASVGPGMSKATLKARTGTLPLLLRPEETCLCIDEGLLEVHESCRGVEVGLISREEALRYVVMRTLWKQGCYMTPGSKFGGDLLAYPDDPSRTHGPFLVIVMDESETEIHPLPLLALSRVSNASLKVLVFAIVSGVPHIESHTSPPKKQQQEEENSQHGPQAKRRRVETEEEEDSDERHTKPLFSSDETFQRASVRYAMFTRKFPKVPILKGPELLERDKLLVQRAREILAAESKQSTEPSKE